MTSLDRRHFLRGGLAGLSLAATAPRFLHLTSRAFAGEGAPEGERILVVLQLSGGNDGLSTVVPWSDPAYHNARRATAIREGEVLKIDGQLGFHPALGKLRAIFDDGRLAVVQGAGYPNPNRSHFKAMDIWHTGDLRGRMVDTGWIGRAIDSCCPDSKESALVVNVGSTVPYALEANVVKPVSFENPESYRWSGNPRDRERFEELNDGAKAQIERDVEWLHRVAVDARGSSAEVRRAAEGYRPKADYPRGPDAQHLKTVAALIAGGLRTRVYYVSAGGFDTHNGQRNRHDNLMRDLDGALGAFFADLRAQGLADRVLLLSFSEFGRRVAENGSQGTDHGVAGPMFLLGGQVKGGLHGRHPSLTDLDQGDLKMQVDFRSVYATVLDRWLGIDSSKVLGRAYSALPVL
jgi:uncharacterized protein (DUF1501 family)